MPQITLLTESELRQCVSLDRETINIIEDAFSKLAQGEVIMPPVLSMDLPEVNGEVDVKTAYIPGLDSFTIKVSPGFFDNPLKGLPSTNGLMISFDAQTGLVKAVLLDNGYLTDIRTAAAGGVAARHLAPMNAQVAGIVGAGLQARLQARALLLERNINTLYVWARNPDRAQSFADEQSAELGISVKPVLQLEHLVRESQIVVTTTPSRETLIMADWLHPGLHITAMGSDAPEKHELDPAILNSADRFVVDSLSQSLERGEMRMAVDSGIISQESSPDELGAICQGARPGRETDHEVTVCDLTGTGVQDSAIADHAIRAATQLKLGNRVDT